MRKVLFIFALMLGLGFFTQPIVANGGLKANSEIEGLEVKVKTCHADANGNVIVSFTLKNVAFNEVIKYGVRGYASEVYDDEGNLYNGEGVLKVSDSKGIFENWCDAKLPKNVPMKYKLKIPGVDSSASNLSMVRIFLYNTGSCGYVCFENVPILREGD